MRRKLSIRMLYTMLAFILIACTASRLPVPGAEGATPATTTPTLPCDPAESRIVCVDRATAQHTTPAPPLTVNPLALTHEAELNTREAKQTPTETAVPATITPWMMPVTRSAEQAGFSIFEAQASYQEQPRFSVTYASKEWQLGEDAQLQEMILKHHTISDCNLSLSSLPRGMQTALIIDHVELAGRSWETRFFPEEGFLSYGWGFEDKYYLFGLTTVPNAPAEIVDACRAQVEIVLSTFALVDQ